MTPKSLFVAVYTTMVFLFAKNAMARDLATVDKVNSDSTGYHGTEEGLATAPVPVPAPAVVSISYATTPAPSLDDYDFVEDRLLQGRPHPHPAVGPPQNPIMVASTPTVPTTNGTAARLLWSQYMAKFDDDDSVYETNNEDANDRNNKVMPRMKAATTSADSVADLEFGTAHPSKIADPTKREGEPLTSAEILDKLCDCECEDYADYADVIEQQLTEHLYREGYYDSMYFLAYDVEACDDTFTCICDSQLLIVSKTMFSRDGNFPWFNLFQVFETAIVPIVDLLDLTVDASREYEEEM